MGNKPYTMRIIDAVGASNLPSELRLLLFGMAHLATNGTGVGLSGQGTIAKFIGCSDRQVRNNLHRLENLEDSPVRVVRRPRARPDGRGRTSDEYQLVLTNRKPTSAKSTPSTGSPLPVDAAVEITTNRKPSVDQPEVEGMTNRKPTSEDPCRDPRSDPGSKESAPTALVLTPPPSKSKGRPRAERKSTSRKPKAPPESKWPGKHQELIKCYVDAFKRVRGTKPIFRSREGKAISELLDAVAGDVEQAGQIIDRALKGWEQSTIITIANDPSKWTSEPPSSKRRGAPRTPVQQTGVDVFAGVRSI